MRSLEPVLTSILSAASSALSEAGLPAELVHLSPGDIPSFDNCCEGGGQLWLRLAEVFPTAGQDAAFPALDSAQKGGCGVNLLALHLALGVMRCAHTIDERGRFPSGPEMTEDALGSYDDLMILLNVIVCDLDKLTGVQRVKVDRWSPRGVQGGCAGGEWGFFVAFDPCLCQPPEE